ncbi:DUF11 domain-containing protein [Streptomyces sp. VRA16 Mangrove soil]|uniref:lectin-like domain-containing protein n=1 Tax=Streptomyces sp. VRA16 Mangrove soil TaxID=2817434 RepID=UPI001A9EFE1A|nr:DUF11 domain-containing protein [Streptomyces sp. VRA16 Mangrove soil]MBO1333561.1 hypothetical protein [Streptomyces sp. VRA16 Mangrove soil]
MHFAHTVRSWLGPPGRLGAVICGVTMGVTALAAPGTAAASAGTRPGAGTDDSRFVLLDEPFVGEGAAPGRWVSQYGPTNSGFACLTAAKGQPAPLGACPSAPHDEPGQGVLRLTNQFKMRSGFVVHTEPVRADAGLIAEFDMYQYGSTTGKGADGISFFLLDGAERVDREGAQGGALGYRDIPGGYLGIGFDQYGNFSSPRWAGTGGPGKVPNSVALRGATSIGNPYIDGTPTLKKSLGDVAAKQRSKARRTGRVTLTPTGLLSVAVDFNDGKGYARVLGPVDVHRIPGQPDVPKTLRFGFSASTGAHTALHEISDVRLRRLPPDLYLTPRTTGDFAAGGTGQLELTVTNKPTAGRSEGPVTVTKVLPPGLKPVSASGDGWECAIEGAEVTCRRDEDLAPGDSFPPIVVPVEIAPDVAGGRPVEFAVDTPGDAVASDNVARLSPDVPVRTGLWLKESARPDPYVAGAPVAYAVSVGNDGPAQATNAPLAAEVPKSLEDPRWTCAASGGAVCPGTPDGPRLDTPVTLPPGAKLVFTATGGTPSDEAGPLVGTSVLKPPPGAADEGCADDCRAKVTLDGTFRTALSVTHRHTPQDLQSGGRITYTISVRNDGPSDASGVRIQQSAPLMIHGMEWTCEARSPSRCGAASGKAPVMTTADIAAGGEVVYTVSGPIEQQSIVSEVSVEPSVDAIDAKCQNGCAATDTARLP